MWLLNYKLIMHEFCVLNFLACKIIKILFYFVVNKLHAYWLLLLNNFNHNFYPKTPLCQNKKNKGKNEKQLQ